MSAIDDFAEWFKTRKTPIERWYSDGVGKFAFRVTVDGQTFVCAARKSATSGGHTSIMNRVAGKAQTEDALIALRLRDGIYVYDPITLLGHGDTKEPVETDRKRRGEKWVHFPVSFGCEFREWYDGNAEPTRYADVEDYV